MEVFLDGLPGTPDNLSFSPDGNIFVSLVSVRMPGEFNPNEFLYGHWWLRKILLRLLHLVKIPLDLVSTYSDLPIIQQINFYVHPNFLNVISINKCGFFFKGNRILDLEKNSKLFSILKKCLNRNFL